MQSLIRLLSRAGSAVTSSFKTQVLRADRVSDEHMASRLNVCRSCPGHHATFRGNGELHTCGPMLVSLTRDGVPTCGCVLTRKARDLKQACPFGYWEEVDAEVARQIKHNKPRVVIGALQTMVSRRGIVGGLVASAASLVLTRRVRAYDYDPNKCYIAVTACGDGVGTHVKCTDVEGHKVGEVFKGQATGDTEEQCYAIAGAAAVKEEDIDLENVVEEISFLEDCDSGCETCSECDEEPCPNDWPKLKVTLTWEDEDETKDYLDETFTNGQTIQVCPTSYGCVDLGTYTTCPYTSPVSISWCFIRHHHGQGWQRSGISLGAATYGISANPTLNPNPFWREYAGAYINFLGFGAQLRTTRSIISESTYSIDITCRFNDCISSNINTHNLNAAAFGFPMISNEHFGQVTTASGVTVKWERGSGNWGSCG